MITDRIEWKVKHTNFNPEDDFLKTILIDNGVPEDQIAGFLRPTAKCLNDPFLMKDMDKAVALVHKHLEEGSRIYVLEDSDADGCLSGALIVQFLRMVKPDVIITYEPNFDKKHGLTYEKISNRAKNEFDLIIVPDASMTCKDAKIIKQNFTADILVIDHHIVEKEYYNYVTKQWITKVQADEADPIDIGADCYTNYCTTINCMDGQYPNTTLSGTGVCQKFVEAYVDTYGLDPELKTYFYDLVSTSEISDVMDIRNLESRYYTLQGMKEEYWNNEFLNELFNRKKDSMPLGRYITSIGWYLAPLINGTVRFGKTEEVQDMYRAMAGEVQEMEYQPKRRHKEDPIPPIEVQTLQKYMARICDNVKSRQDNEVRRMTAEVDQAIQDQHLDENSIIFVDGTKILTTGTVTGLVASKLTNKYFRPVVLMRSKNALEFGGSGRNYSKGNIENLKEFLEQANVACAGHEQAFGITLSKHKLNEIVTKCNQLMPLDQMSICYSCDWEIPAESLRKEYVQAVAENYSIFCSTVPEPMFLISGLEINAAQIQAMGEGAVNIKFTYKGITFNKKFCSRHEFEEMTKFDRYVLGVNKKRVKLDLICTFELNKWDTGSIPEVKIVAFQSEEIGQAIQDGIKTKSELNQSIEDIENNFLNKKLAQKYSTSDDDFAW